MIQNEAPEMSANNVEEKTLKNSFGNDVRLSRENECRYSTSCII